MPVAELPTSTGARIESFTPLRRHCSSSGSEISSPSRYFVRTSSSASAAASRSWSRRRATSSAMPSGMAVSTSLPPCIVNALRWTRSTYPVKSWAAPMARWSGAILLPKVARSASSARVGSAFSLSHLLMKKHAAVFALAGEGDGRFQPRLDPAGRVRHQDRAVGGLEARDHLGDEVQVARCVEQRDARAVALERGNREAQRLAPLLLLGLVVEMGRPVIDLAEPADGARAMEELFAERRLAGTRVPGQDDAPKVGEVDVPRGHGPFDPRFRRAGFEY